MLWTLSKPILRHYIIPRYYVKFNRKTRSQQRKRDLAAENRHRKGVKASVKYKVIYRHREKYSYPNLLNRNFSADRPNQKWATDISYIRTGQGFLFLSIIRDLYDNSIVAYKTAPEQSTKLVLDTVRAAKGKEKVTAELQLHSDQGFQYTSQAYFKLTQRYGITPSMSRRGNPYDNALAENFFSILKTECIYRTKIATLAEAKELMDDYIFFYNNQRIQSKTKLTPLELRRQYLA